MREVHDKMLGMHDKIAGFQQETSGKPTFVTRYTYGNDTYSDYSKVIQLIYHFSTGGWLVQGANNMYYTISKEDVQKCKEEEKQCTKKFN